jgi:hypothetical protein
LLGYSLNSKAYRVYKQSSDLVKQTSDIEFDETNGSQEEQKNLDDVGNAGLTIAMNNMIIGGVKPKDEDDDDPSPLFQVLPSEGPRARGDESRIKLFSRIGLCPEMKTLGNLCAKR